MEFVNEEDEKIHIRQFDNIWKILALAACCIHWFNPLVWIMRCYLEQDLEMACDEGVLHLLGEMKTGFPNTMNTDLL